MPSSSAQIRRACRRASATPALRRESAPSPTSIADERATSGIHQLLTTRHTERGDHVIQTAVQDFGQVVHRKIDPMVGDPALREVIGSYFGRSIPGSHHVPAISGTRSLLL